MRTILTTIILVNGVFCHAQSWSSLSVGTPANVMAMSFPANDTGYVLTGNNQIRKTTDGALNWSQVTIPAGVPVEVEFINGNLGFIIVGTQIQKTTNGGQVWTPVLTLTNRYLYNISFADPLVGYASANNSNADSLWIYKTIDGGNTWNVLPLITLPNNVFFPFIYFMSPLNGFVAIDAYTYRTTDGGLTWTSEYYEPNMDFIYDMHSPDGVNVFAGYETTAFASSGDGGDNWTTGPNTNHPCLGVYFTSATHGYYCGGNGFSSGAIEETNNGGTTWTPVHTGNSFYCMEFPSPTTGYVGGTNGVIVKYSGPTGVEENTSVAVACYPNPASDLLTVVQLTPGDVITITNALGEVVYARTAIEDRMQIDVSALAAGTYFLDCTKSDRARQTTRIVIAR